MEQDISVIIDVDPDEANLLLQLIEELLAEWYIRRYEREERMRSIVAIAANKKEGSTPQPSVTSEGDMPSF
jgi:hypothetical protein